MRLPCWEFGKTDVFSRDRYAPTVERLGVAITVDFERLPQQVPMKSEHVLMVLRILQEGLGNAMRHGQPTAVAIRAAVDADRCLEISVENSGGVRFAPSPNSTGRGLGNMQRRAGQIGGTLDISPTDGGAMLRLLVPLAQVGVSEVVPIPARRGASRQGGQVAQSTPVQNETWAERAHSRA